MNLIKLQNEIADDEGVRYEMKYKNINKDIPFFKNYLSNIDNTKLYWSLLRCLNEDYIERIYLYI